MYGLSSSCMVVYHGDLATSNWTGLKLLGLNLCLYSWICFDTVTSVLLLPTRRNIRFCECFDMTIVETSVLFDLCLCYYGLFLSQQKKWTISVFSPFELVIWILFLFSFCGIYVTLSLKLVLKSVNSCKSKSDWNWICFAVFFVLPHYGNSDQ